MLTPGRTWAAQTATGANDFAQAAVLAGFDTGPATAPLAAVVFFDPQCPHCARLWHRIRQIADSRRIHWVPVVLLSKASIRQGAYLLQASDPIAMMDAQVLALSQGRVGPDAETPPSSESLLALRVNTAMLRSLGAGSVPLLFLAASGRAARLVVGAPPLADLALLLGLASGRDASPDRDQ